ncbi:MAG TPA: hypothetical protein VEZ11_14575 [Thermoanaerobaculia bacterium]|nr:hypothetical protein [Thermoanaerobaculia bacterium]
MKRAICGIVLVLFTLPLGAAAKAKSALPALGTELPPLPAGRGKAQTEAACSACHSSELILQQTITDKQWTATVEKMMRWGAEVSDADKPVIIEYLSKNFGPQNTFTPVKTAPVPQ